MTDQEMLRDLDELRDRVEYMVQARGEGRSDTLLLRDLLARLEAAERERDDYRRRFSNQMDAARELIDRAEAAEAKIAAARLYCENQGDKFRYHAARILAALQESEGGVRCESYCARSGFIRSSCSSIGGAGRECASTAIG